MSKYSPQQPRIDKINLRRYQSSIGESLNSDIDDSPTRGLEKRVQPVETNQVKWDGPDDPKNPQNCSVVRRWWVVGLVSATTFNMYNSIATSPNAADGS